MDGQLNSLNSQFYNHNFISHKIKDLVISWKIAKQLESNGFKDNFTWTAVSTGTVFIISIVGHIWWYKTPDAWYRK